ncbi:sodium:solute symporter [Sphingosinicella sp. CPCC 101087]|uniref:sodium:solute symporter family protein n=1 Tax=Sphingosinicella sp. CPCC 101087 TaxID=2497754 RepID=UPI00101D0445|nr:sodium:solute symporter family protein [Sphingosinicella sp. CPCC 101087]
MILALTAAILLGTVLGAVLYGRSQLRSRTLSEWAVGGRRFGFLIFWFLNAGEIYTTFAVLGISGFAWAYGAPAYLALTSVSLAATLGYWLMPRIWEAGRRHGHITQADFFAHHYRSRWLAWLVALAGIAAIVVYVQIQITALGLIVRFTLGPEIGTTYAAILAAVLMLLFVFFAGLRSAAFAAGVKDVLMVMIVVGLSVTVADRVGATSMIDVYRMAQDRFPDIGHLPGLVPAAGLSTTWLMTSALNVALGTWIFPQMFQLCYAAGSRTAIRRNALWQPIYSLSYFFIILLGFAALLVGTDPQDGGMNAVLLQFVSESYPAWAVGLFAGTACLLALVPGSVLLLTAASIFTRNVVRPLRPTITERQSLLVSRISMFGFAAIAVWLTIGATDSLVEIGLSAYATIGMLAPGVFLAFLWKRANALGVGAGLAAGYVMLLVPSVADWSARAFPEWEPGLVAMGANAIVAVAVIALTGRRGDVAGPDAAALPERA